MQHKTVLITGATGGLGSAMAKTFAAADWRVVCAYHRNRDGAESLAESLSGNNHYTVPLKVDAADSVTAAFEKIQNAGGLSLLINNAGITRFVPHNDLTQLDDDLIDNIFRVHVRGALACARAAVPLLRTTNGAIINITSVAAQIADGSNIAYCAAKAALNNITLSLARALAPHIRVNALAPGLADTDFIQGLDAQWRTAQIAATPLARLVTPDDVAQAARLLAEQMPAATGIILPIDGGRPLR